MNQRGLTLTMSAWGSLQEDNKLINMCVGVRAKNGQIWRCMGYIVVCNVDVNT